MFIELDPRDFCEIWVPKIYGIAPGASKETKNGKITYRQACLELLAYLCEAPESTVSSWIDYDLSDKKRRPSRYILQLLRAIHLKLIDLEGIPSVYADFIERIRTNSKLLD